MNILWIEDFDKLDPGNATLSLMFQDLMNFDDWDEDEFSLLNKPTDLEDFFKKHSALHCVYLCRHYFDYIEFKENNDIFKKIDAIIIDIRLNNKVDFDLPIPNDSQEKEKFHNNAGFYIFNDLVHLGFPADKMCFMTGEMNSFTGFSEKCAEIYIPKVVGFEKTTAEYEKLRKWIKEQESDYTMLRRGIIEGCDFLKSHIDNDDGNIQFRDYIKTENKQPAIEIPTTDIKNYLDVLSQCLPLKQPILESSTNIQYRLFLRTLVHEWEENIEAKSLKEKHGNDLSKICDIYTFAWLMKMTRNWVSHANLLEPLNPQIIAFLFLVNMRAMFKLPKAIKPYENLLMRCISLSPTDDIAQSLTEKIDYAEQNVEAILAGLNIPGLRFFGEKINAIYRQNTGNPDAEEHSFKGFLLQYFWINQKQKQYLRNLTATSDDFLPTLARHIYKHSFS